VILGLLGALLGARLGERIGRGLGASVQEAVELEVAVMGYVGRDSDGRPDRAGAPAVRVNAKPALFIAPSRSGCLNTKHSHVLSCAARLRCRTSIAKTAHAVTPSAYGSAVRLSTSSIGLQAGTARAARINAGELASTTRPVRPFGMHAGD
jgi:hypothetical protein